LNARLAVPQRSRSIRFTQELRTALIATEAMIHLG